MTVKYNTTTFIRKLQEGDAAAWQQFDEQYRPKILAYLRQMRVSAEDAEDIYHEALVKVLQRIDGFEPNGHFDRWLFRIAVNQCIDYLRRRRRSPELSWSEDALQIAANDLEPSRQVQQNELRQKIDEAITSLPPRQQQIAYLRLREEMKFGEIADAIGGNAASLKSMFAKAKKKLQLQLVAYLQVLWLPWRRLKGFVSSSAASQSVALPIALTLSLSLHVLLIISLRHLPIKSESIFTPPSVIVTVDSLPAGRGAKGHQRPISISGRKNRPALKTGTINFVSADSTASLGRTSGGGFASTSSLTPSQPVAVIFPEIQTRTSEATEFPDVMGTQAKMYLHTPSTSIRRQEEPAGQDEKASLLSSQNTKPIDSLQVGQSDFFSGIYREAEYPDEIKGGFLIGQDAEAFGGQYLVLPKGVSLNGGAIASYQFTVTEAQAGEYYLWGRVLSKNGKSDSFRVSIDDSKPQYIWDTGIFQQWTWTVFVARQGKSPYIRNGTPQKIHLTAGEHTLSIFARETNTQLDALLLSQSVLTKAGEVIHALPQQPLTEGWVDGNAKGWQLISSNEPSEVFTSYIRFGSIRRTLISWPSRRLRFSEQPLELAFSPPYLTYLPSNHRPPKRLLWFYHQKYLENPTIFFISFGSRSEIFVVASPVVFLSNESGLLAVQGVVGTLDDGLTFRQQRQLRQALYGNGRLILLASPQGSPRLRREVEKIFRGCEWKALSRSHPLFLYPSQLPANVSIEGLQLQVNKGNLDKIRRKCQVLLVEIAEKKVVPQFLWNLSHFKSRAGSLPVKEGKNGN